MNLKSLKEKIYEKFSSKFRSTRCRSQIRTTNATTTYYGTSSDEYIGVNFERPATIYLPTDVNDGKMVIVKSEMKPPLAPRKITITTVDGSTIDGYKEDQISVSHDSRCYIYRSNNWHRLF